MRFWKHLFLTAILCFLITSSNVFAYDSYVKILSPSDGSWIKGGTTVAGKINVDDGRGEDGVLDNLYLYMNGTFCASWMVEQGIYCYFTWQVPIGSKTYQFKATGYFWGGTQVRSDTITVYVDDDSPSVSLLSPSSGGWYKGGTTIPIKVAATDSGSGVSKIEIYVDSKKVTTINSTSGTYNWTASSTGSHTIYAKAYDNVGNTATSSTNTIYVDSTAPSIKISSPTSNTWYKPSIPLTITLSGSDTGSGVKKIELYIDNVLRNTFTTAGATYAWTTPSDAGAHTISATIYDNVDLTGTSSVTVNIDNSPPILGGNPSLLGTIDGYTNAANLNWSWDAATDSESGFKEYQVYVTKDGAVIANWISTAKNPGYSFACEDGKTYVCKYKAVDNAGNETLSDEVTVKVDQSVPQVTLPQYPVIYRNGSATFTWNPITNDFSGIQNYETALTQTNSPPTTEITGITAPDSSGNWTTSFTGLSVQNTYYAWVRAIDNAGNTGAWKQTGVFPNFQINGPSPDLTTNNTVQTIQVQAKYLYQGEEMHYRVYYQNVNDLTPVVSGLDPVTVEIPTDGNWQWWVETVEYQNGAPLSGSTQTSELFSFTVDRVPPGGTFSIQSTDGSKELSATEGTNCQDVLLVLGDLNDDSGVSHSGVKGLWIWNEGQSGPPNATYKKFSEIPSTGIAWKLPDQDGLCKVNIQIEDGAGNQTVVTREVMLDRVAPPAPAEIKRSYNQDELRFNWVTIADDLVGFSGVCKLPNGTSIPFQVLPSAAGEGTFAISVAGLGSNQPVTIAVRAIDRTGNASTETVYTAYTLAQLGGLQFVGVDYDTTQERHCLKWQLIDGTPADHILEYGDTDNEVFIVQGYIHPDDSGLFVLDSLGADHVKLTPHDTYHFRLVAINNSGDRQEGIPFDWPVPNIAPTKPVPVPLEYVRGDEELKYQASTDYDGDSPLIYKIWWREATEKEYHLLSGVSLKELTLVHGRTYYWYVTADDRHQGVTSSDICSFTVDKNAPVLSITEPHRPFTNQTQLLVKATDDLSGIQEITYKKAGDSQESPATIGPDGTAVIPLDEGSYDLQIFGRDKAGNVCEQSINNLKVDRTMLPFAGVQWNAPVDGGRYLLGTNQLKVKFTASDDFSGVNGLRYWLLESKSVPTTDGSFIYLSSRMDSYSYTLQLDGGEHHKEYYLATAIEDQAGNRSEISYQGSFYFDLTPPEAEFNIDGLKNSGTGYYLSDLAALTLHLKASDPETKITTEYAIISNDINNPVGGWNEDWTSLQKTPLTSGTVYRIAVKVVNGAGLSTLIYSGAFIDDNTAPENLSLMGPTASLAPDEQGVFTAAAQDNESSIQEYRLAIVSADSSTDWKLTSMISGNEDGWVVIHSSDSQAEFRVEMPAGPDGKYYPVIQAVNGAGLTSSYLGKAFVLDQSQEKVVVSDQGPYTMFDDHLTGWWKYTGQRAVTGYHYQLMDAGDRVLAEDDTNSTTATVSGLKLESGHKYRFKAWARFSPTELSQPGISSGITVDTSSPVITELSTPEYSTSQNLAFKWAGQDSESQIGKVAVALGSGYQKTDVSNGWITVSGNSVRLSCDANGKSLQLVSGKRYYLTVRVYNGAGLVTERCAPSVMIDDSAPPTPLVVDQGSFINPLKQALKANWLWTPVDPESGPVKYEWALIREGQDLSTAKWNDAGTQTQATFDNSGELIQAQTYYFVVRATNQAGLTSTGYSDGIMIDNTAPVIPEVQLLQATNQGDQNEVYYITNTQNLELWINTYDQESGINSYLYGYGNQLQIDGASENESTSPLISVNPDIDEGEITLFKGSACNGALQVSQTGYSPGVVLDTGAPQITEVAGVASGNYLLFNWSVIPSTSPVEHYEVALVKASEVNANPAPSAWINVGLSRRYTVDAANLDDGYYCLLIRACNEAGTYSRREGQVNEWGVSPVVLLDRQAPDITGFNYGKYASDTLTIQLMATDNLSGIGGYQYTLGSKTNLTQYSGDWVDIVSQAEKLEYQISTVNIPHNSEIYLTVRAKDQVGLYSKPQVSQGIIIDHTKPSLPEVDTGAYINSNKLISQIHFASTDPESGVTQYSLGIVAQKGGERLLTQIHPSNESVSQISVPESLNKEGQVYYLAVQTQNGAGDWSDIGFSGPITVDTKAPVLTFEKADTTIVTNQDAIDIFYTLSEDAKVQFTLDGSATSIPEQSGVAGNNCLHLQLAQRQRYTLIAKPVDPADNIGDEQQQKIRYNALPEVTLPPAGFQITPGAPLQLSAIDVTDPDGEAGDILDYQWDPGDGTGIIHEISPVHSYSVLKDYTVTLTVRDKDGGTTVKSATVNVGNTTSGNLYMDEVWSGIHHLYGDVTVPEGITLTILPGTQIIVDGNPMTGYNHKLTVKGTLLAEAGNSPTTFRSVNQNVANGWRGIYITGLAVLENTVIQDAMRGLAIMDSANVIVANCTFQGNYAGIHVYGAAPLVRDCTFMDNVWYGIKEDENGRPTVIGCGFSNNYIDYYDDDLTKITMKQLNAITGNSGNHN